MKKFRIFKHKVVCLCGSTKFKEDFLNTAQRESLVGNIVLLPSVYKQSGDIVSVEEEEILTMAHYEKIRMADEILVINPGGYIGEGTKQEIQLAVALQKTVRYLFEKENVNAE